MLLILYIAGLLIFVFGLIKNSTKIIWAGITSLVIATIGMLVIPNMPICYYEEEKVIIPFNSSMVYYSDDNGGYKVSEIGINNIIIYEDDNCTTPYVVKCVRCKKPTKLGSILLFGIKFETKNYEIHVPAGTMEKLLSTESQT